VPNPKYSPEFERAWVAYQDGLTPQEKARSGKIASSQVWARLGLDKALGAVLGRIKALPDVYSSGYRPGMQKWIRQSDFTPEVEQNKASESPVMDEIDWGLLSVQAKKQARTDNLSKRHKYFHNPSSIYWAISSIAKGEEKGPPTVGRVLELAVERADLVKAGVVR